MSDLLVEGLGKGRLHLIREALCPRMGVYPKDFPNSCCRTVGDAVDKHHPVNPHNCDECSGFRCPSLGCEKECPCYV